MNIITIDPSTTCTGICINGKTMVAIAQERLSLTKKGNLAKWFEIASSYCHIETYPDYEKKNDFTDVEIEKLCYYKNIADIVVSTIYSHCKPSTSKVAIEGFSYNSKAGNLIDLVTYSTLIRSILLDKGYDLIIMPPASLKKKVAELVYPKVDVKNKDRDPSLKPLKPKFIHLNKDGIAGGNFKKPEMLQAIKDSDFNDNWKKFIDEHYSDLIEMKNIPAPMSDLNDAYLLYQCIKNYK